MEQNIADRIPADPYIVTGVRLITESTFVLRFSRGDLQFRAGQRILAGLKGDLDQRDYSVYSGESDDYIEILAREIIDGNVSSKLRHCKPGQILNINGPFGAFFPDVSARNTRKLIFVATGTGISPFHSLVRTFPDLDYTLIHGVRYRNEAYDMDAYDPSRYVICTSKEFTGGRMERVTGYLTQFRVNKDMLFYLCGNGNMIYEVYHILTNKGVPPENIFSEIYF